MKGSKKQITFYKGHCLKWIHRHMVANGSKMTLSEVDKEIKINAGFTFDSCANENVTTDDLGNLIVWAFLYGDAQGIFLDYPADELDKQIKLNID